MIVPADGAVSVPGPAQPGIDSRPSGEPKVMSLLAPIWPAITVTDPVTAPGAAMPAPLRRSPT
ncbi:MAG: hypothetical protein BWY96_01102 [Spirochaetes bacterium ADurb.BinA120]|nr:MAG: hypothetical protein BWY96_01102 [Spirochaetes bacterium ADurb.BinA120]OQB81367.1 MAG: hypothetical protein BWX88_04304 [Planctomycetes bacterium ADurb.Bin126]